jgi:hypothetical protein
MGRDSTQRGGTIEWLSALEGDLRGGEAAEQNDLAPNRPPLVDPANANVEFGRLWCVIHWSDTFCVEAVRMLSWAMRRRPGRSTLVHS